MLSSISPLGERTRNSRWWVTTSFYVLGSVLGGLAIGVLAGAMGWIVPEPVRGSTWFALLIVGFLLAVLTLDLLGRLPSWHRQVNENWLTRYRGWVIGLGFGAQLGFGLVTIITSATTHAMVALACWTGSPAMGAVIAGVFGLVRALPSVAMGLVRERGQLHGVFAWVERGAAPMDTIARASLLVAAGGIAAVALT